MLDTTKNALRALLPDANDTDIQAAEERFHRYLELAIEVYQVAAQNTVSELLTQSDGRGTVIAGQVEPPRTLTNTG
ncbi:MAG TPA: hypothetical protein VNN25_05910 [Thermoanaerobaculia bacterium]|nr:hypothetical protein [Thermoanaerobaculia bacterium]